MKSSAFIFSIVILSFISCGRNKKAKRFSELESELSIKEERIEELENYIEELWSLLQVARSAIDNEKRYHNGVCLFCAL